jgi:hypothetical protein
MPYFVFRFTDETETRQVELLKQCDSYREAKQLVVQYRKDNPDMDINTFRMVFADNIEQGRILLTTRREKPIVEEWES